MIASEESLSPMSETTAEEQSLPERSSAPTLRDLRVAAKDLMAIIAADPDWALSGDGHPRQTA